MTRNCVELTCDHCGIKYKLMPSEARKKLSQKHHFHSPVCYTEWRIGKKIETKRVAGYTELVCDQCGITYPLLASEAKKKLNQAHQFCTVDCYIRWKTGRPLGAEDLP